MIEGVTIWSKWRLAALATPLLAAVAFGQTQSASTDTRPTIAVTSFTNGALGRTAEFAELSAGIQEIMITTLAAAPNLRVVERKLLQQILDEQHLSQSDLVDESTAVRVGRILSAQHFVAGGFIVFRGDVRIDVRAFNTETSRVEYTETIQGKEDELLSLIDRVSRKVASGLKLSALPSTSSAAKPPAKASQTKAVALLGRALLARDRGDTTAMLVAAREALVVYPDFAPAKAIVDSASRTP